MQNRGHDLSSDTRVVPLHPNLNRGACILKVLQIPGERPTVEAREPRQVCPVRPGRLVTASRGNGPGPAVQLARNHGSVRFDGRSGWGQCGLFAVDIAGFTEPQRDEDIQLYMHKSLYEMLEIAFERSDVPWSNCYHEDRGDGVLVVAPPMIPAAALVPIPDRLRALIRRHNRVSCVDARIQLRTAAHLGPVHHDGRGLIGTAINLLCRLLDARPLKQRLADPTTEIALIASDYLYYSVIRCQPSLIDPSLFEPVRVRVKNTAAQAWVYAPSV